MTRPNATFGGVGLGYFSFFFFFFFFFSIHEVSGLSSGLGVVHWAPITRPCYIDLPRRDRVEKLQFDRVGGRAAQGSRSAGSYRKAADASSCASRSILRDMGGGTLNVQPRRPQIAIPLPGGPPKRAHSGTVSGSLSWMAAKVKASGVRDWTRDHRAARLAWKYESTVAGRP